MENELIEEAKKLYADGKELEAIEKLKSAKDIDSVKIKSNLGVMMFDYRQGDEYPYFADGYKMLMKASLAGDTDVLINFLKNRAKSLEKIQIHKDARPEQVTRAIFYSLGAIHGMGFIHNALFQNGTDESNVDLIYREGDQGGKFMDKRRRPYAFFRNVQQAKKIENDQERKDEIEHVKGRLRSMFSKWRFGLINPEKRFERLFQFEYVKGFSGIPPDEGTGE